jgi:Xaa-Pro aminopeptidase
MNANQPEWELTAIFGHVNQYYFTGTMQDGVLLIPRDGEATFWVRRSFERARNESLFPDIRPMKSFRDAARSTATTRSVIHVETEVLTLGMLQRFRKYFPCRSTASLDAEITWLRAVKSSYEIGLLERAGAIHHRILVEDLPNLLREGMNEAELTCDLFKLMVREGHQGVSRFGMFGVEVQIGQIGFGDSSVYPTSFNGPGGNRGLCPAAPIIGSRKRALRRGDLVFVDVGFGLEGYHTDKTVVFSFGQPQPPEVLRIHRRCLDLERRMASVLKPGAIPSQIYATILRDLDEPFRENFMGCGNQRVQFLGHGVGLVVDEYPVIAEGFDEPMVEGMVLALEPKKGLPGVGMVGTENTYLVTPEGGRCLTGGCLDLIQYN